MVEASRGRLVISLPLPAASTVPLFSPSSMPASFLSLFPHYLKNTPLGWLVNSHLPPPPCGTNATRGVVRNVEPRLGNASRCGGRRGRKMRWRMKGYGEWNGRDARTSVGRAAAVEEDRRAETVRRFVTVTRALASSGERVCTRE